MRPSPRRSQLVVLVESDPASLQSTAHFLRELGCRVIGFTSVQRALDQLPPRGVDLVLDGAAAPIAGRTLAAALRERLGAACPPVLLAAAGVDPRARSDYDGVVAKPIRVLDLVEALERSDVRRERAR